MRGAIARDVVVAERFRLVRELGRGGMGAVWLAHHLGLGVLCAVKFDLRGDAYQGDLRRRFEREARAAALLRSPHVVQMLDHGIWEDRPYIAMEYLEGEDLRRRLDRVGRLSTEETVRLVAQVARGLSRAHAASVVHRDLKPDNIFLTADPEGEVAKILDFGIAKAADADGLLTSTTGGAMLGTPAYMSPEQLGRTAPVDHRCDLWALGVIVFECLAGKRPFESGSIGQLVMQILSRPMVAASKLAPDLPPGFDAWWARASARDPEHRFQSARELADALAETLCEGSARRPSKALEQASSLMSMEAAPPSGPSPASGALPRSFRLHDEADDGPASLAPTVPVPWIEAPPVPVPTVPSMPGASMRVASSSLRRTGVRAAVAAMGIAAVAALLIRWMPTAQPGSSAAVPSVVVNDAPLAVASPAAVLPAPVAPIASSTPELVSVAPVATASNRAAVSRSRVDRRAALAASSAAPPKVVPDAPGPNLFDRRK
jgi:serine/threonine protein kinase